MRPGSSIQYFFALLLSAGLLLLSTALSRAELRPQVGHIPAQPKSGQPVTVTARFNAALAGRDVKLHAQVEESVCNRGQGSRV